jgi:hypothetical protein
MRSRLRAALVLVLTIGLLAFFLRNADMAGVWAETRQADPGLLTLVLGVTLLTYVFRTVRWQYLLAPLGRTHFSNAFEATVIGFTANFLLPARAGEVIRPYVLARREPVAWTSALATIVIERLFDLVAVLVLFAFFVAQAGPTTLSGDPALYDRVKMGGIIAAALSLAGLGALFFLAARPTVLAHTAARIDRVLPASLAGTVGRFVETFAQGLAVLRDPVRVGVSLLLSFPVWLSIAAGYALTARAFHMTFGYVASFLVMALVVIGVMAPTPGAVGGFHAMFKFAVTTFFGVPADRAVGAAVVLHALSFIPVTLLGLAYMAREGLSLGRMQRLAADTKRPGLVTP